MHGPEEGVAVVVWRRSPSLEVLLLHRSRFGSGFEGDWAWTTPGGARRHGEAWPEAAARELVEETGLVLECRAVHSDVAARRPGLEVRVFVAESPVGATVVLSDEHDRYEWVGVDELSRCLPMWVHEMYREVLPA